MAESEDGAKSLHILIVEDNFPAAQSTGWVLEAIGHTYALAASAAEAMIVAAQRVPDVVLLDIGLPERNGFDLCRDLRKLETLSRTVFVAHTGYGDARTRQKAIEAGFSYFLLKPFELPELEAILTEIRSRLT